MNKLTARCLKALAAPERLVLLCVIGQHRGTLNVARLQEKLCEQLDRDIEQPTVSYHLGKLLAAGLIEGEKAKLEMYYHLKSETLTSIIEALEEIRSMGNDTEAFETLATLA